MNDEKKAQLKQVFWDMNELYSFTSTVPGEGDDEEDTTTLHITVAARTADEMADIYGFNAAQRRQLAELPFPQRDISPSLWASILSNSLSMSFPPYSDKSQYHISVN